MGNPNDDLRSLDAEADTLRKKLRRTHEYTSGEQRQRDLDHLLEIARKQVAAKAELTAIEDAARQKEQARKQRIEELAAGLRSKKSDEREAARKALDEMAAAERAQATNT